MRISIDRLKPSYILSESTNSLETPSYMQPSKISNWEPVKKDEPIVVKPVDIPKIITRIGRHLHFPKRLITKI